MKPMQNATLQRVTCGHTKDGTRIIVELLAHHGTRYIRATRYLPAPRGRLILSQHTDTFAGPERTEAGPVFARLCRAIYDRTEARR